jgi:hypothetical protein
MAGNLIFGADGDPTEFYRYLVQDAKVKSLSVIQGNHDLPPKPTDPSKALIEQCFLPDGKVHNTDLGRIGGVHGIISNKPHPYKVPEKTYLQHLKRLRGQKLDILVTHDTPRFIYNGQEFIGKDEIYNEVLLIKPKIYIYGHCHHYRVHTEHKGIHFLNVDGRVLIINPPDDLYLDGKTPKW